LWIGTSLRYINMDPIPRDIGWLHRSSPCRFDLSDKCSPQDESDNQQFKLGRQYCVQYLTGYFRSFVLPHRAFHPFCSNIPRRNKRRSDEETKAPPLWRIQIGRHDACRSWWSGRAISLRWLRSTPATLNSHYLLLSYFG